MDIIFNNHEIQASTYKTVVHNVSDRLVRLERTHLWAKNSSEIDVFGKCWSLSWMHYTNQEVCVKSGGEIISLDGPCAILIPPFSIVNWQFKGGEIYWQALLSDLPDLLDLPYIDKNKAAEVLLFRRMETDEIPNSVDQLATFLRTYYPIRVLNKPMMESAVADRVRMYINTNMANEYSISKMAEDLGFTHSVMDRAFKKSYGLSPIQYRNNMRVLDSAHRFILGESSVSNLAFEVGFSGIENFNKQFKKKMQLSPSHFIHS